MLSMPSSVVAPASIESSPEKNETKTETNNKNESVKLN
jgi:hypothetical protein